jgi:RAT1-interacting protein
LEPRHRLQSYYGYSFESYCTSSTPDEHKHHASSSSSSTSSAVGWGGDVDTNVQWCSVVKTKLGDTRIIIGGEVDCVRGMCRFASMDRETLFCRRQICGKY